MKVQLLEETKNFSAEKVKAVGMKRGENTIEENLSERGIN